MWSLSKKGPLPRAARKWERDRDGKGEVEQAWRERGRKRDVQAAIINCEMLCARSDSHLGMSRYDYCVQTCHGKGCHHNNHYTFQKLVLNIAPPTALHAISALLLTNTTARDEADPWGNMWSFFLVTHIKRSRSLSLNVTSQQTQKIVHSDFKDLSYTKTERKCDQCFSLHQGTLSAPKTPEEP